MSRRLTASVWLRDADGALRSFTPDDDVPEWAADQIGDHAWVSDEPAPIVSDEPPPRAGAGSSRDAWVAYAEGKVDTDDDMGRDEIIAALEGNGYLQ